MGYSRGHLVAEERNIRSQLARLVHRKEFLLGSLVDSTFKCGKDSCWCTKARKGHPACYLSILVGEKRKKIYVPKDKEKHIRELVKNYKEITKSLAKISKYCLKRFREE